MPLTGEVEMLQGGMRLGFLAEGAFFVSVQLFHVIAHCVSIMADLSHVSTGRDPCHHGRDRLRSQGAFGPCGDRV